MASIPFTIYPPDDPGIIKLHIFESPAIGGPFMEIEVTTAVGVYPTYIDHYTTTAATSVDDWFAIQWESTGGVLSAMSAPVKGNTNTLVGEIVDRVLQRDSGLNKTVVRQESEAAIEGYFGKNPYDVIIETDIEAKKKYKTLNGLTYLVMARSMLDRIIRQSGMSSVTLGVVSMKSGTTANVLTDIQQLIDYANMELGGSISMVMLMEEVRIGSSISTWRFDQSRLMLEIGLQ